MAVMGERSSLGAAKEQQCSPSAAIGVRSSFWIIFSSHPET